jgi:exonuclease 3'-5' domain-containing protein 2
MKNSLKTPAYHNCKVLDLNDQVMFHCGKKKANWYLNKKLADVISIDPFVIKFNFETNGSGHIGDDFYLQERENKCVCCGAEQQLTKHHVVPHCYRKYFPNNIKNHSYHDVLPLCICCHEKYEQFALEFRKRLAEEYDVPIADIGNMYDKELKTVVSAASALVRHSDKIPLSRRTHLVDVVKKYYNKNEITQEEMDDAARLKYCFKETQFVKHSELMVEKATDMQRFVEQWRAHFLAVMQPQHMPKYWEVKRSIYRDYKYGKLGK